MMNKLATELQRLFLLPSDTDTVAITDAGTDAPLAQVDAQGRVRALVFELTRAPDWDVLARVWRGVQAELDLPAPGIAVSGVEALQLWFSLAQPVPAVRARAFLQGLQQRFLADVDARRVRLWPAADAAAHAPQSHAAPVPALQASGNWSAFVAPDLVPVFGDTPWLDIPPNEEGQANLLRALKPIQLADFDAAMQTLGARAEPPVAVPAARSAGTAVPTVDALPAAVAAPAAEAPRAAAEPADIAQSQARRFLLQVMHDEGVGLALRIEAAKALLQPGQ